MSKVNQNSPATDYISYGYALAILAGGVMGYAKAKSIPSLAAGVVFGAAATLGAYQVSQNPKDFYVAFLTSGALLAVMGARFYKSRKIMPAGLIAGLSLVQVARLGTSFFQKN